MEGIHHFLFRMNEADLLNVYEKAGKEIHKLMDKLYSCAFRFNLSDRQTVFLIREILEPLSIYINLEEK